MRALPCRLPPGMAPLTSLLCFRRRLNTRWLLSLLHRPAPALAATGASAKVQEVANPGLYRQKSIQSAQKAAGLRAEVDELAAKVAALESKVAAQAAAAAAEPSANVGPAAGADVASIAELVASLQALTAAAAGDDAAPTSARVIGAGGRPSTAPYRTLKPSEGDDLVSWSADAFGKSKTPGWYHTYRKDLYAQRAARAAAQPTGCYISHSKYADEAVRIAATGRLAFSAGK